MGNQPVNLFEGTINTLSRSLDLRARKHELTLNNVANADTPNFKPFALNVEEALQREAQATSPARLSRTDEKHLAGRPATDGSSAVAETSADNPLLLRGDENGVDIDAEMTALAKNSLLYKASTQIVTAKFKGLKAAITGGKQ
jgi:flagellar basal-body rod protein FlgB